MTGTAQSYFENKINLRKLMYKKHVGSRLIRFVLYGAAAVCMIILVFIIGYIVYMGIPNLKWSLFEKNYNSENVSLLPALVNTAQLMLMTLSISVPIGIFSAVYLVEYAKKDSLFVRFIKLTSETLQGIPSIVFGLFGYIFFVTVCGLKYSMISGTLTMSIMILPLIIRTAHEALYSVSDSFREGSYALGAGKVRTVFKIILPQALSGIMSGIILSIGRIAGESAALIYTAGSGTRMGLRPTDSARTLAVHLYCLYNEGLYLNEAFATAFVLLLTVIVINSLSGLISRKLNGQNL